MLSAEPGLEERRGDDVSSFMVDMKASSLSETGVLVEEKSA